MTRWIATCLGLAAVLAPAPSEHSGNTALAAASPPLRTRAGVVAADHLPGARAGADVLAEGGNAADAAVATALALGVVNPASSGIGGGGFALVYVAAEDRVYAFDFREVAPAALRPESFVRDGAVDPQLARRGGLAVAVPGEVAGLERIVHRFGRRSFRRDLAPAIELADRGFPISGFTAGAIASIEDRLDPRSPLYEWLHPDGIRVVEGQRMQRPALARALARIAGNGSAGFYRGPVADDIVATVRGAGGVMTAADLAGYQVVEREPLWGSFHGLRIATMPLPSSGGIVLLETLGILEATGIDLAALGAGSSASLHLIGEALRHGFADRSRLLGGVGVGATAAELLEPARLARLARRIDPARTFPHDRYGEPVAAPPAPAGGTPGPHLGGTSHLCVVDRDGNAVALTTTVNSYFGSKLVTPRFGIVLDNEVDDFTIAPGTANAFDLVQGVANLVAPGKRPLSSMTPTLVFRDHELVACLGSSGGPHIITAVVQVFLDLFVWHMDVSQAVAAPRIHDQWLPDQLYYDADIPADVVAGLSRRGHKVAVEPDSLPSAVQAVRVNDDGTLEAASDPRKGGSPAAP